MTNRQIKWAASHDWYITTEGQSVIVRDESEHCAFRTFDNFAALYIWAGY